MENTFDINKFRSPDVSCAPVYVWVWNDVCTREIIDSQLSEMKMLGIRAFYILPEPKEFRPGNMPTRLEPDYLSQNFFDNCAYAIEKADSLGMCCWLYDEGGWPSGGACGKVLNDHPEHARKRLKFREMHFSRGAIYQKSSSETTAALLNDVEPIEEGFVFSEDAAVIEYYVGSEINGNSDYPDLLNAEATEYFIKTTHEKYIRAIKDNHNKNVFAMFTDEPKAPANAYNEELTKRYESLYGEPIAPHLPLIAGRREPTQNDIHILRRWYDLCSRMFCENYMLLCKKWANSHGLLFTGHLDKDHDPRGCMRGGENFNLMRALRCFDIPGVDVIKRQLYPENKIEHRDDMNAYNGFFPRYASSAAAQTGMKYSMAEIFGVAGPGITYDIMRYTAGYLAVRGINIFNLFNFPLGRDGNLLAQELPIFTFDQPYYKDLQIFNRYLERLSYVSSLGNRVCETALYYPVNDFQGKLNAENAAAEFDALGRELEDNLTDFDIIDDDVIQNAKGTEKGTFCAGLAAYSHIIIPKSAYIPEKTREALDRFKNNGGKVSFSASCASKTVETEGAGMRAMRRKTGKEELILLFREGGDCGSYRIHLPRETGFILNLESGVVRRFEAQNGHLKLHLEIGETAVIILTDKPLPAQAEGEFKNSYLIPDSFCLSKHSELTLNETGFYCLQHAKKMLPVCLGDWAGLAGADYSGSCVYETEFSLPDESAGKKGKIDLGDVRYTAEVTLNGAPLGKAIMPPYKIGIPENVLKRENTLRIVVTNTPANLYTCTDFFDKWDIKSLSPYFEEEKEFAKSTACGGLYGPVKIITQ